MSFEINPVLAGKFDVADNAPANNYAQATNTASNIQSGGIDAVSGTEDAAGVDARRYTKFDHSDTEAGTATLSFSDFVDMFNPLEHIPVVSSVYRAVAGDSINPVSRVVGDILYGGVLGAGSAVLGGVSAVADAGLEQQTGKDSGGLALAMLFGPGDKNSNVQLAAAGTAKGTNGATAANATANLGTVPGTQNIELAQTATATPLLAALAVPVNNPPPSAANPPAATPAPPSAAPVASVDAVPSAPTAAAAVPTPAPAVSQNAAPAAGVSLVSTNATSAEPAPLGGIPLAPPSKSSAPGAKQPFGGVMGTPDLQAQDMALALSQGAPSMRMGHMIYTNKLVNGAHPLPPMLSNGGPALSGPPVAVIAPAPVVPKPFTPVSASGPSASALGVSGPALAGAPISGQSSAMPAALMQDMMMKALGQYGKVAIGPAAGSGANINLMN